MTIEHGIVIRHDQALVKDSCGFEIETPSGRSSLQCACGLRVHGPTDYVRRIARQHLTVAQEVQRAVAANAVAITSGKSSIVQCAIAHAALATEDLPYQMVLDALAASREALTEAIHQHGRTVTRHLTVRSGSALVRVDKAYAALLCLLDEAVRTGGAP